MQSEDIYIETGFENHFRKTKARLSAALQSVLKGYSTAHPLSTGSSMTALVYFPKTVSK